MNERQRADVLNDPTIEECPRCRMPRDTWPDDSGGGALKDGVTYCCKGCADDTGCTCRGNRTQEPAGQRPAYQDTAPTLNPATPTTGQAPSAAQPDRAASDAAPVDEPARGDSPTDRSSTANAPTADEIRYDKASGDYLNKHRKENKTIEPDEYGDPNVAKSTGPTAGVD
jgi:hypothetical protein